MGSKERKCVNRVGLGGLFDIHQMTPRTKLLKKFLQIWEEIEDDKIHAIVCGKKFTIDQI